MAESGGIVDLLQTDERGLPVVLCACDNFVFCLDMQNNLAVFKQLNNKVMVRLGKISQLEYGWGYTPTAIRVTSQQPLLGLSVSSVWLGDGGYKTHWEGALDTWPYVESVPFVCEIATV